VSAPRLVNSHPIVRHRVGEIVGHEMVARLLDLERDMLALLERELPDADADRRAACAARLALVIATDVWFSELATVTPGKVDRALAKAHRAARNLLKALDALPPAAEVGVHLRLLGLDMDPPTRRQAFLRERVWRTAGRVDAGLNRRRAGVAEIANAASAMRAGMQGDRGGDPRVDLLASAAADTYEALKGPPPRSGTGEGPFYRLVAAVLAQAGLRHVSSRDVALREARRRYAARHSGGGSTETQEFTTYPGATSID
jgi:hypothetical protein